MTFFILILALLLFTPFIAGAHADEMMNVGSSGGSVNWSEMMNWMAQGMGMSGFWFTAILYVVWLIVGILLIIWLLKKISK